jgi:molecular chaperone DnaJ
MNPHEILGVTSDASEEDIKKAYKKLAMEWHPDRHGGDSKAEEKFKEINTAYQILTGKIKQPNQGSFQSGFPGFMDEEVFEFFKHGNYSGSIDDMFRAFVHQHQTHAQVRFSMQVSLEEACAGGQKTIHFSTHNKCPDCYGSGRTIHKDSCLSCGGTGRKNIGGISTVFNTWVVCSTCLGLGKELGGLCQGACGGTGTVTVQHKTIVDLPPGISNGETIVAADGSHITVYHKEHRFFKIVPRTLNTESEIEISLFDLMLGGLAAVPTLVGEKRVKIDIGLRPGSRLRIRGAGMLDRQGNRGDHVVRVWAEMPKLTEDQQQVLKKMRSEIEGESNGSTHT